ncbi:AAA family ATPase [Planosporangium sp. 12N6]|uniref:AAA family ATPase n=1 Tax=Planosporangium spinosum TaxID=3402278 RepID=UPI003CEE65F2
MVAADDRTDGRARVPRLIVLNGPPACGKSTLAWMYADAHPLTLNLDIDRVRGLIGRWKRDPSTAGLLARALALAAARTHLLAGHDVVIPQFLGRPEFLERVEDLARELGADFHEIVLLDSRENVLRRFAERTRSAADPAHLEAQDVLDRLGGYPELSAMYDRLLALIASRPTVKVVPSEQGDPERTYRLFLACLDA